MATFTKEGYLASIEESASIICKELGPEVVQSVYRCFGARNIEELKTADLPEVFSELYAIEADLKPIGKLCLEQPSGQFPLCRSLLPQAMLRMRKKEPPMHSSISDSLIPSVFIPRPASSWRP